MQPAKTEQSQGTFAMPTIVKDRASCVAPVISGGSLLLTFLCLGFASQASAAVIDVSSFISGSLYANVRVGHVVPPDTLYSDHESQQIGDVAPVSGLPSQNNSGIATAGASSQVSGYVSSNSDVRGSVYRDGQILDDAMWGVLVGATGLDLRALLARTGTGDPINVLAQAQGTMSATGSVTFTITTPSVYTVSGQVSAFGPSTASATLVSMGASPLTLFYVVVSQSEYDPSGFWTARGVRFSALLNPGTYTLSGNAYSDAMLEAASLSPPGNDPRIRGNAYFGISFDLTPVPIPPGIWMLLSGIGSLSFFQLQRGRAVLKAA